MRCQIHMEIAQIEDEEDRTEVAIGHIQKALILDGTGQYQNFLKMYLHRLQLRTTLYTKPQRVEDQAAMILEQVRLFNVNSALIIQLVVITYCIYMIVLNLFNFLK